MSSSFAVLDIANAKAKMAEELARQDALSSSKENDSLSETEDDEDEDTNNNKRSASPSLSPNISYQQSSSSDDDQDQVKKVNNNKRSRPTSHPAPHLPRKRPKNSNKNNTGGWQDDGNDLVGKQVITRIDNCPGFFVLGTIIKWRIKREGELCFLVHHDDGEEEELSSDDALASKVRFDTSYPSTGPAPHNEMVSPRIGKSSKKSPQRVSSQTSPINDDIHSKVNSTPFTTKQKHQNQQKKSPRDERHRRRSLANKLRQRNSNNEDDNMALTNPHEDEGKSDT